MEIGDETRVHRAQAGDLDAFEELVLEHQRFVFNLALRATCDPHEAEDIAQEAFLRAWRALPEFRGQSGFRTWLYRITINLCYNRLPGLKRSLTEVSNGSDTAIELPEEVPGPQAMIETEEQRHLLKQAVQALPEGYRIMTLMRYQREMSYEEIAEVLDIPVGTVKTGLFRAKQRLREMLMVVAEANI